MLEEELTSICVVLEGAAESIQDKELKALVSRCCGNLSAAAEQARALENGIPTAEMAALDRKLSTIENDMQEAVDAAKSKASQLAGPLQARRKELSDAVAVFAKLNRQDLFAKNKSLDMGFGVIGFRASTKIVQLRGVTAEMTLERLHQYHLTDGIRVKEEINKDAAMGWPDERLELVGLKRQQSDTFFIEISKEDVPDNG